jgi:PGF-CTERM protein
MWGVVQAGSSDSRIDRVTPTFRLLVAAAAVVAAVAVLSTTGAAQTACQDDADMMYFGDNPPDNCHVLGGSAEENNLRVFVADGLVGTQRYENGNWQQQYYTYGGALVVIDGQKTSLGYYHYGSDDPSGGWGDTVTSYQSPDSQSRSGNTVTTVWTVDDVRIVQRVTLSSADDKSYRIDFDVENRGSSGKSVTLLRGEDTYLAGGDSGNGFWNADTETIGVTKTEDGTQQRLSYTGITSPDGYRSARFDTVIDDVESGSLENAAREDFHDNGYALEWGKDNLAAGETWEIESVGAVISGSIIVSSAGTKELTGSSETFTFDVRNVGDSTETVDFSTDCPASGLNCSTPETMDIPAGETRQVDVNVSVDNGTAPGTYDVVLVADPADGDSTEGVGQLVVPQTSDEEEEEDEDEEEDPKITAFDATGENGTITVTFESEANPISLDVAIEGPDAGSLIRDDFSGDIYAGYEATYDPEESGTYTVTMTDARDSSNRDLTDTDADLSTTLNLQEPESAAGDANETTNETTPNGSEDGTPTPTEDGSGDTTTTPTDTPTPTDVSTPSPTEETTDDDGATDEDDATGTNTSTEGDGPGFGALAGLLALLGGVLLVYRRR